MRERLAKILDGASYVFAILIIVDGTFDVWNITEPAQAWVIGILYLTLAGGAWLGVRAMKYIFGFF